MKPWIVMGVLAAAIVAGRWFLWAYPDAVEASAHIGWLISDFTTG
jgi:hypothetical protein